MLTSHAARVIAGKIGYAVVCLLASVLLVVAGYAHKVAGVVTEVARGVKIGNSPSAGAMNILVMGLESRTDYEGNVLSPDLLAALHAGKVGGNLGSQDTNTLILIHIFAGGQKAVGFSIPRDSYVSFPQTYLGYSKGKIDAAYNWAYTQYLNEHAGSESRQDLYLHANQAGQLATVDTVESVTGVHIDHFAEVNLAGFYYLAKAFGGVEVCIKPAPAQGGFPAGANLTDQDNLVYPPTDNSGFSAYKDGYDRKKGGAQYLHLSAAQSLAYVRSRDTLPGVDVGRTYRQQAVIDYVVWKLKHDNGFTDFGVLNSLLGSAGQFLITDAQLDLLQFAPEMRAISGQNLNFTTLPGTPVNNVTIAGYPQPQDIYQVDVPSIQHLVQSAFAGKPAGKPKGGATSKAAASVPAPSTVTVDVYNGNPGANGLATQVSQALVALGYKAGAIANASAQSQAVQPGTQVFFGKGASANAAKIAAEFGASPVALASLPAGHVEILTGSTVIAVPPGLVPSSTPSAGTPGEGTQSAGARLIGAQAGAGAAAGEVAASPTPTASGTAGEGTAVAPNAKYGVPCAY